MENHINPPPEVIGYFWARYPELLVQVALKLGSGVHAAQTSPNLECFAHVGILQRARAL